MIFWRKSAIAMLVAALGGGSAAAFAAGNALIEHNASGLGNAYAGAAAAALDASTIYYNPAGMSRLRGNQLVVSTSLIVPSAQFSNWQSAGAPLQPVLGGNGGDAGSVTALPSAFLAMEINPQTMFGIGVNIPFGLQSNYDANWIGRFQSIKATLVATNINPSLSYRFDDSLSVGAGISYQRMSGEMTSAVNYSAAAFTAGGPALLAAIGGAGVEGVSRVSGTDYALGYNFGLLYSPSQLTRIGLAYRSRISYTLQGSVSFTNRPALLAAAIPDGAVTMQTTMPDSFSASIFHSLDSKWDVMADATWTGWSVQQQQTVLRPNGTTLSNVQYNWRDTWRIAGGASYHYDHNWTARFGIAYDQSPVPDAFRTASLPDSDRTWVAAGGQYRLSNRSAIDFGYAHLFLGSTPINRTAAGQGTISGNYSNYGDVLSAQYTLGF